MKILIVNGPNLNLLGTREPEIYGNTTFEDYLRQLRARFSAHTIEYFQSNYEGEIIEQIQKAGGRYKAILLNAGGYTHTSVAIADAIGTCPTPVVEVHISCLPAREPFRHTSLIAPRCAGSVMGFGLDSYAVAVRAAETLADPVK